MGKRENEAVAGKGGGVRQIFSKVEENTEWMLQEGRYHNFIILAQLSVLRSRKEASNYTASKRDSDDLNNKEWVPFT